MNLTVKQTKRIENRIKASRKTKKRVNLAYRSLLSLTIIIKSTFQVEKPGPEKWQLIDLQYHADSETVTNLCTRAANNGITPSTATNVKDTTSKHYRFLWAGWVKLPAGMVMKRYNYQWRYNSEDKLGVVNYIEGGDRQGINDNLESYSNFIVHDDVTFNNIARYKDCYSRDVTNPANCGSSLPCNFFVPCKERCPQGAFISSNHCLNDPVVKCKTIGTEAWFFISGDYAVVEAGAGEDCKIQFVHLRISPTRSDSGYGTTDCSDYSDPLRIQSAFSTNRNDPNSIITQDSDEIKLQPGYEGITVKKMTSAFVLVDKNHFYVNGFGNAGTGAPMEIDLEMMIEFPYMNKFVYALIMGKPTLFKFFDLTRWDPEAIGEYHEFFQRGATDAHYKFLFENMTPYGFRTHPDMDMPTQSPISNTGEKWVYFRNMPLIDFDLHDFCSSFQATITIVRTGPSLLLNDGSNKIRIRVRVVISDGGDTAAIRFPFYIIITQNGPNVEIHFTIAQTPFPYSSFYNDFKIAGSDLLSTLSYPLTWPDSGTLELTAMISFCPVDMEPGASDHVMPALVSLVAQDSELPGQIFSFTSFKTEAVIFSDSFDTPANQKVVGLIIQGYDNSASDVVDNVDFYVTSLGIYKGGFSPTMLDLITLDTTTYPEYTFWRDHFARDSSFTFISSGLTKQDGSKHPDETIFIPRCSNNNPKSFASGNMDQCLTSGVTIPGCLRYRADTSDPTKPVCERCDYNNGYWLDKSNPEGVCVQRTEDHGVEVNCDPDNQNYYEAGECHTCTSVQDGCVCNDNQVKLANGTCSCSPTGCGVCLESLGSNCQFCFPSNLFQVHPNDAIGPLVCIEKDRINLDSPGSGEDKTSSPPSLAPCQDSTNCQYCAEDYQDCSKCTGSDLTNPTEFFSKSGNCVQGSTLAPGEGAQEIDDYTFRIVSCNSNECSNCLLDFQKCQSCPSSDYYLHDLPEGETTCTHQTDIPPGLGVDISLQKLVSCFTENCNDCGENFGICQNCVNSHWLNDTEASFCQKRCEFRQFLEQITSQECSYCSNGCQKCSNITGECFDSFEEAEYLLQQVETEEIYESDVILKLDIFHNGGYPNLDIFNESVSEKKILEFTYKQEPLDSYTRLGPIGNLQVHLNITEEMKKLTNQNLLITTSPYYWNNGEEYSYPSVNINPLINLKNLTKEVQIKWIDQFKENNGIGTLIGSVEKYSEPTSYAAIAITRLFDIDPSGLLMKFSQFLFLVKRLIFINVEFGPELLTPFFERISGFEEGEIASRRKAYSNEIWLESKKYRGKFTKYSIPVRILSTFLFEIIFYSISVFFKYSFEAYLRWNLEKEKKMSKFFWGVLKIQRKIHLTVFGITNLNILFYGTRILNHREVDVYVVKAPIVIVFVLLLLDFYEMFTDALVASRLILENHRMKTISEKPKNKKIGKNMKKIKDQISFKKVAPTGNFSIVERLKMRNRRGSIGEKGLGRPKKLFGKDKNSPDSKNSEIIKSFDLGQKSRRSVPLAGQKSNKILPSRSHIHPNLSNISLSLSELSQSNPDILKKKSILFTNLLMYSRNSVYQVLIPSLSTLPSLLITLTMATEFTYFVVILYNYIKRRHVDNFFLFLSKFFQSLAMLVLNLLFFLILMQQKEGFFRVSLNLQRYSVFIVSSAILLEYLFIFAIVVRYVWKRWIDRKGKWKKLKNGKRIKIMRKKDKSKFMYFGFDFLDLDACDVMSSKVEDIEINFEGVDDSFSKPKVRTRVKGRWKRGSIFRSDRAPRPRKGGKGKRKVNWKKKMQKSKFSKKRVFDKRQDGNEEEKRQDKNRGEDKAGNGKHGEDDLLI